MAEAGRIEWYDKKLLAIAHDRLVKWLDKSGFRVETAAKRSMRGKGPSAQGTPPGIDTGTLRRSVTHQVNPTKLECRVGSNVPHARIQEMGGTITAKGSKLTIPLNEEAAKMRRNTASLNTVGGLKYVKVGGTGYLVKDTENDDGEFMFVLKDSVTLPPRPYLRPALDKSRGPILQELARMKVLP